MKQDLLNKIAQKGDDIEREFGVSLGSFLVVDYVLQG